jgi:hypothetical protein
MQPKIGSGDRVGHFLLESPLGEGGAARVFLARDTRLDRPVVLKLVHSPLDPAASSRFVREARLLARLTDPHVVKVLDAGADGELLWLAMEHTRAVDLRSWRPCGPPLAPVLRILADVLRGLAAIHALAVIHRDVKPENVLVLPDGSAQLADLGLAQILDASRLTVDGKLAGTPQYLSPEMMSGEAIDARSDLYQWALVAHELLAGDLPFPDSSLPTRILRRCHEPVPSLSVLRHDLPRLLCDLVDRNLSPSPDLRHQSAQELLEDLSLVDADRARATSASSTRTRSGPDVCARSPVAVRTRRRLAGAALVASAACLIASTWWAGRPPSTLRILAVTGTVRGLELVVAGNRTTEITVDWVAAGGAHGRARAHATAASPGTVRVDMPAGIVEARLRCSADGDAVGQAWRTVAIGAPAITGGRLPAAGRPGWLEVSLSIPCAVSLPSAAAVLGSGRTIRIPRIPGPPRSAGAGLEIDVDLTPMGRTDHVRATVAVPPRERILTALVGRIEELLRIVQRMDARASRGGPPTFVPRLAECRSLVSLLAWYPAAEITGATATGDPLDVLRRAESLDRALSLLGVPGQTGAKALLGSFAAGSSFPLGPDARRIGLALPTRIRLDWDVASFLEPLSGIGQAHSRMARFRQSVTIPPLGRNGRIALGVCLARTDPALAVLVSLGGGSAIPFWTPEPDGPGTDDHSVWSWREVGPDTLASGDTHIAIDLWKLLETRRATVASIVGVEVAWGSGD